MDSVHIDGAFICAGSGDNRAYYRRGLGPGKIRVKGISLGVTWVFFAGIFAGHIGFYRPAMLAFAQNFGLVLFVYELSLQVDPDSSALSARVECTQFSWPWGDSPWHGDGCGHKSRHVAPDERHGGRALRSHHQHSGSCRRPAVASAARASGQQRRL